MAAGNSFKYQDVFDELRREILSGKYGPGQKLPSEAALIKRFGASRITVGRAVNDLRTQGLVERRAGSGTFVCAPVSDDPARSFGLLIPNLGQTEIFESICQGMTDAAGRDALIWGRTSSDSAAQGGNALQSCRQYIDRKVSGVFFAPLELSPDAAVINRQIIAELDAAGIPVVLLDRDYLPYPSRSRHDLVGIDNRRAGYMVTEHLLKLGCRRIAFVSYPMAASTIDARLAGYREALLVHGVQPDPELVRQIDPDSEDEVRPLADAAEAIVCANDTTAGTLMHALLRFGCRIPADVRMVGVDDVRYAALLPVPLTTVHQPCVDIGAAAMAAMEERLAHPTMATRDVLLSCKLVVRDSCGMKQNAS